MRQLYVDEHVESFLIKLWHRSNDYQELADKELVHALKYRYEQRCYRLRRFYASVHRWYKVKQVENSGNYVFKK